LHKIDKFKEHIWRILHRDVESSIGYDAGAELSLCYKPRHWDLEKVVNATRDNTMKAITTITNK